MGKENSLPVCLSRTIIDVTSLKKRPGERSEL